METKVCVGALIYNEKKEILLTTSPKWKGYVIPGGKIDENETETQALHREIKEELGIEIEKLQKAGEKYKQPSSDFIKDNSLRFKFIDYFAKAKTFDIKPNNEIKTYAWFEVDYALEKLELLHTTRELVEQFKLYVSSGLI